MIVLRTKLFAHGGGIAGDDKVNLFLNKKLRDHSSRQSKIDEIDRALKDPEAKKELDRKKGRYHIFIPGVGGPGGFIYASGTRRVSASKDQLEREKDLLKVSDDQLSKEEFNKKWNDRELEGDTREKRLAREKAGKYKTLGVGTGMIGLGGVVHHIDKISNIDRENLHNEAQMSYNKHRMSFLEKVRETVGEKDYMNAKKEAERDYMNAKKGAEELAKKIRKHKKLAYGAGGIALAGAGLLGYGIHKHLKNRRGKNNDGKNDQGVKYAD